MLMPRKTRHRKQQRGRLRGETKGGSTLNFGDFGIQALEPGWITARQIEAARIAMTRHVRRGGKVWIRVFPDKPVTEKPAETRMGSGKGNPEHWVAVVKPGRILFELGGVDEALARSAMERAIQKLPDQGQVRRAPRHPRHPGGDDLMTKVAEFVVARRRGARAPARRLAQGAVQPALPVRDRPARQLGATQRGAPRHRADADRARASARSRPHEALTRSEADEPPTDADARPTARQNARKVREGIVVSDKMQASIVVAVSDRVRHPRFGKTVQRTKRLYAHDEKNEAKVGDLVRIIETRPLSKLKRWRLTEIVERAR